MDLTELESRIIRALENKSASIEPTTVPLETPPAAGRRSLVRPALYAVAAATVLAAVLLSVNSRDRPISTATTTGATLPISTTTSTLTTSPDPTASSPIPPTAAQWIGVLPGNDSLHTAVSGTLTEQGRNDRRIAFVSNDRTQAVSILIDRSIEPFIPERNVPLPTREVIGGRTVYRINPEVPSSPNIHTVFRFEADFLTVEIWVRGEGDPQPVVEQVMSRLRLGQVPESSSVDDLTGFERLDVPRHIWAGTEVRFAVTSVFNDPRANPAPVFTMWTEWVDPASDLLTGDPLGGPASVVNDSNGTVWAVESRRIGDIIARVYGDPGPSIKEFADSLEAVSEAEFRARVPMITEIPTPYTGIECQFEGTVEGRRWLTWMNEVLPGTNQRTIGFYASDLTSNSRSYADPDSLSGLRYIGAAVGSIDTTVIWGVSRPDADHVVASDLSTGAVLARAELQPGRGCDSTGFALVVPSPTVGPVEFSAIDRSGRTIGKPMVLEREWFAKPDLSALAEPAESRAASTTTLP